MKASFYVKCRGRKKYLNEDNVYTICPFCGKEHTVDLVEVAERANPFDLYDTSVICEDCSRP